MKIIDVNGKERTVKDDIKIIIDKKQNDVNQISNENVDGELVAVDNISTVEVETKFVEVNIIGKNSEWREWYPLEQFEEMNPEIRL